MRRILIGYLLDGKTGGIDRYLINLLDVLKDAGAKVDFLTPRLNVDLRNELQEKGVELYEIDSLKHPLRQYKQTRAILREGAYDTAYFNISEAFNCIGILAAAKEKIPNIIVHSHSSGNSDTEWWKRNLKRCLHELAKHLFMGNKATEYIACSKKAGEWMYPQKITESEIFQVLNNAIQVEKFFYDPQLREKKRCELKLENRIVVGHVGSFCYAKNMGFLIDIVNELRKMEPAVILLSIGGGEEFEYIQKKVEKLNLQEHVCFLGNRDDVPELLQAMDLFVLPSRFEGLPIVAIEAQVSGLKVVLSNTISEETALSEKCIFCDIHSSAKEWAQVILKNLNYFREQTDFGNSNYVFDIKKQDKQILNMFQLQEEATT